MSAPDAAKRAAAERALDYVSPQMKLGLGTGSTAAQLVELLGERAGAGGFGGVCVATSSRTAALAEAAGLRVAALNDVGRLDLTIDGADEFDPDLNLIKGGGGALLQEKIVAAASERMIVIADASKAVDTLGAFPLPVEIVRFGWRATVGGIEAALAGADVDGRRAALRMQGDAPFVTDERHHIVDLHLGRIGDPDRLATALTMIPGVVEAGLFIGMAAAVVVGREDGRAEIVGRRAAV